MASFTDWLARTLFISSDAEQTANDVKANQAAFNDRLAQEGKIDPLTYLQNKSLIQNTGTTFYDEQLGKSGAAGLPGLAFSYWYVWLILGLVLFTWFGGWSWLRKKLGR